MLQALHVRVYLLSNHFCHVHQMPPIDILVISVICSSLHQHSGCVSNTFSVTASSHVSWMTAVMQLWPERSWWHWKMWRYCLVILLRRQWIPVDIDIFLALTTCSTESSYLVQGVMGWSLSRQQNRSRMSTKHTYALQCNFNSPILQLKAMGCLLMSDTTCFASNYRDWCTDMPKKLPWGKLS